MKKTYLVTGGLGFIGTNFVKMLRDFDPEPKEIIITDCMTYASQSYWKEKSDANIKALFVDIRDQAMVSRVIQHYKPDAVFHFAAESHVCRSIAGPKDFITTNVMGTWNLLEEWRVFHEGNPEKRFIHVSTDEVFGELLPGENPFSEKTPVAPRSPYASSKASSDLIALSYFHTYGTPVIITNCSNNFGPHQHEEKLIPATLRRFLSNQNPVLFGSGEQIRDWIWVEDHCRALLTVHAKGKAGERYCVGGECELTNKQVIERIRGAMAEIGLNKPEAEIVYDLCARPTDDKRYAINNEKIRNLGWKPQPESFQRRLEKTIEWYVRKWKYQT